MSQRNVLLRFGQVGCRLLAAATVAAALGWMHSTIGSAQTAGIAPASLRCPDCVLTGQTARPLAFDPDAVQFVTNAVPFVFENRGIQFVLIGRVLRASPLIVDILDAKAQAIDSTSRVTEDDIREAGGRGMCEIHVFSHVDARWRMTVSTLAFNDLISATVSAVPPDFVLTNVQEVTGSIAPFHTGSELDACVNHTGQLVHYHGVEGEDLTVYNDGRIEYRALGDYYAERDTLSAGERAALLRAFAAVNFDRLPETLPKPDWGPQPEVTLSGARYQPVSLYGHESELRPLIAQLDAVAAKAEVHARFRLTPGRRAAAAIVPWSLREVDLSHFYDLTEAAAQQQRQGADRVPGDFALLRQPAPASIPLYRYATGAETDPNKNTYFSQGGSLYRVERPPTCGDRNSVCRVMDLRVEDILAGGASLDIPGAASIIGNRLMPDSPRAYQVMPGSLQGGKVVRERPIAWLWPSDAGLALRDVPPGGAVIDSSTFGRHKSLYASLLKTWTYGVKGLNFIEGNFIYDEVQLCHVVPGSRDDACEVIP